MADLFLNWGDIGPFGTVLGVGTTTVDTGGVDVAVAISTTDPLATAFTFNADGYVEDEDNLDANSFLKLSDDANDDGIASTMGASLTFSSSDDMFTDQVQNVSFRINDIDFSAVDGDLFEPGGGGFQDVVTVTAFDADGNAVPVTLTPEAGGPDLAGDTLTGNTETDFTDATGSVKVDIAGPIERIEIAYANEGVAQQSVTISNINFTTVDVTDEPPVAVDDTATTDEDVAVVIDVLSNDSDPEGGDLTVVSATTPTGTVDINPDGTLTYTPPPDYNGPATITYTIEDPDGNQATGEVAVTVDPVNDAPVANPDEDTTPEETPITVDPLANDTDPDGDTPLELVSVGEPTNGDVTQNPDGTVTYTPDPGFVGEDTIPYVVGDGNGGETPGQIIITVTEDPNAPPVAVDDPVTTDEDTPVTIDPTANDTDPDGDPLTVTGIGDPANGTLTPNVDGTYTYTPDPDFNGEDTIPYTVDDGNGGTDTGEIIVTVTPVNDAPVANPDEDTTPEETPITVDPLANDTDPDGDTPLELVSVGEPTNGDVTQNPDGTVTYTPDPGFVGEDTIPYVVGDGNGGETPGQIIITVTEGTEPEAEDDADTTPFETPITVAVLGNDSDPQGDPLEVIATTAPTNGAITVNDDETITYTPNDDFTGEDTFTYTISDGNGGEDTATVTVTVLPEENGAPVAEDDTGETPVNTPEQVFVQGNDSDPDGDDLTTVSVTDPLNGEAVIQPDGSIIYTPDTDFTGVDTFDYTIEDEAGNTDTATVTVTVTPAVNDDPEAVDDADTTPVNTPITIAVLGNDTDPEDDDLTTTGATDPDNGDVIVNDDGTVTYTPDTGFTGEDTFSYTIEDEAGNTDTATVTVTVTDDPNSAPDAVNDTDTTPVNTPVTIAVLDNDTDPEDDTLSTISVTQPTNGVAAINPADGTVTYTPNTDFTGEDTFTYTISDGNGGEDTATVTVTVADNEAPTAVDDPVFTNVGTPVTLDPADNDTDPEDDPLTVTGIGTPTNGEATLNPDGTVTYTPNPEFIGEDTIPYTIDDGNGNTDTGEIIVTVEGRIDTDVFPVGPDLQALDPLNGQDEDPDPEDDRDSVVGTSGDDTIETGDDRDTIIANGGDDSIRPGIDDDLVELGGGDDTVFDLQGSDTILGGAGDDVINAGVDTFSDYEGDDPNLPILGFTSDPNPEDGRDSVQGNLGNDIINTGDDRDTIDGGGDNDTIDAGIDDDLVMGGQGDDSIIGGHGSDTLDGGQGDDFIDGSNLAALEIPDETDTVPENDRDSIDGALGDDTLIGGDDDDTLIGGSGEDLLDGGIDEDLLQGGDDSDTLIGGDGDDTLNGGAGPDSLSGGAGRDTLIVSTPEEGVNDTIDGGSGGFVEDETPEDGPNNDYDVLDLRGVGQPGVDWRVVNETEDSNGNGTDGTIEFLDGDTVTGSFDFFEIEEIVPCFTPGTLIATPQGERLVEDLEVGDRIITRDNGIQEIRWIGRKDLTGHELARKPHMNPILIRKGALGNGLPEHDLMVSPNHRVLVANDKTALYFEEREVLVAAKHLTGLDGVEEVEVGQVGYIHVMFDQHEVVLSNGAWTESFQPGDYTLKGIGNAQRQEIFELFPELEHAEGLKAYGAARRALKKHEAQLLTK